MELVFRDSVVTCEDVSNVIKNNNISLPDYRLAVIVRLMDKDGNVILQRRGPKSRDEHNKLEDIGGAVEDTDINLIEALYREIKEEVGELANIEIKDFVGAVFEPKFDIRTNKTVNWLFCIYNGLYIDGELLINDPGKCLGYEFYNKNNLPKDEMSYTSVYFNSI